MVLRPSQHSARRIAIRNLIIFAICLLTSYTAMRFLVGQTLTGFVQNNIIAAIRKNKTPEFVDLQWVVDEWVNIQTGKVAVMIYDLDNKQISATYHQDELMPTASLYKLLVAYEWYRLIDDDVASASDVVYKNYTRSQCLDLMIRESHSPCAETLLDEIGQENFNKIAKERYGLANTEDLTSTAADLIKILQIYYQHDELSNESWATIKDSMLNQPVTNGYNWRAGLPSGFSNEVLVYDKVGWESKDGKGWSIYNDAAIIEFPIENRHLSVVVLTNNTNPDALAELGSKIEAAINEKK